MPPAHTHLVVHYHRPRADYYAWHLALLPSAAAAPVAVFAPAIPEARTSFGALFRIPLAALPDRPHLLPCLPHATLSDGPPRRVRPADEHVFLLQGAPRAHPHPALFPSLFFLSRQRPPPLLRVYAHRGSDDVFPASPHYTHHQHPAVYIVTVAALPPVPEIRVALHTLERPPPSTPQSDMPALPIPSRTIAFFLSDDPPAIQPAAHDLRELIVAQASVQRVPSKPTEHTHALAPPSVSSPPRAPTLTVYCHMFDGPAPTALSVESAASGTSLTANPAPAYHGQSAFTIDLSAVPEKRLSAGLSIAPTPTPYKPLTWKPDLGLHVIHAESFASLLTPAQTDLTVVYHRFSEPAKWADWELHVWTDATATRPAQSAMVRAEKPATDELVFDLSGLIFPSDAEVRAQPVRMATFPAHETHNEHGEIFVTPPRRDADRRDVVRSWTSARPVSQVMHFVQGDSTVYARAPDKIAMRSRRRFRLRYRRFEPNDYEGWDLWVWDDADPQCNRVAIQPTRPTPSWVDFVIDRADFGAAARISVVPRRGGEEWLERDEPLRIWDASLLDEPEAGLQVALPTALPPHIKTLDEEKDSLPTFLIVQNRAFVLRRLAESKSLIRAYVDTDRSVVVSAPVPVSWVSPPRQGRPNAITETTLKLCDSAAEALLLDSSYVHADLPSRSLRFQETESVSRTEFRLIFSPKEVVFAEDFLVENVILSVPGFDSVPLTWQMHEDWDRYLYPGTLGWEYTPSSTSFRCFSPTADRVYVVLYDSPTRKSGRKLLQMRRIPHGCWKAVVDGNLKGKFYKLLAEGENKQLYPGVEVIDPYSRCNTSHTGRGLIFGTEHTRIHPRPSIKPAETIVYELHIRDVSIDAEAGIRRRGKFMGLAERGTRMKDPSKGRKQKALTPWEQEKISGVHKDFEFLSKLSTGLDHIAQMGVTAIQILPIQDFDNDEKDDVSYRWGYMPVHFNSPDGWYASETHTVARVTEFKRLVDAVHKAGLKVIMDVVYNHTAEDSNEFNHEARFSFNGIAPRYYYRTCGNTPVAHNGDTTCGLRKPDEARCGGCYSNGSGCGNEFRSESPMGRKFIIDSLKYWATEFQIDGFRFDLLGLIDVETLTQASSELREIDPNIMIYGEPWAGGLTPIQITDKGSQRSKGFGVFNDTFRNAIRGSPFGAEETFIMDGGRLAEVKGGIIGSVDDFCDNPPETINYVECHDNYTLWDHMRFYIRSRTDDIKFTEVDMRRMNRLAAVIVFTSQGIPFMQIGQEMCRTKFDVENSYESPDDINMVRWSMKLKEWTTVQYYRGLILLRRAHPEIFCLETAEKVHDSIIFYDDLSLSVPDRCIAYRITGNPCKLLARLQVDNPHADDVLLTEESLKWSEVVVLLNPTPGEVTFELPDRESNCIWYQVVDAKSAGVRNIRGPAIGGIAVQGRSASVFRRASAKEFVDAQLELRLAAISDAYCSFHGDDLLSRYAVGLDAELSVDDRRLQEDLMARRKQFERRRQRNPPESIFNPSPEVTEAEAVEALNRKYGKVAARE